MAYRHGGETERVWVADQGHPIANDLDQYFEIPSTEMYGEQHDGSEPDRTVFRSRFEGGDVFRSEICYRRDRGRLFAFRLGHEEHRILYRDEIRRVIANAVAWAAPNAGADTVWGVVEPADPLEE